MTQVKQSVEGLSRLALNPELFLLWSIPPLLYADPRALPRRDLLRQLQPVLLMALVGHHAAPASR